MPKIELLAEICDLLGTTPNVLLGFEAPPVPASSAPPRETNITTGDIKGNAAPIVVGSNNTVIGGGNMRHHHRRQPSKRKAMK